MKQKKNLFIIINVAVFLPLIWIYNSNNNLSTLSKSLNENSCLGRKLVTRIYRLLANYKQQYSNNVYLKKKFQNNGVNEKKDIHSNKMDITAKRKQSNRSLLNKAQYYTEIVDYNNGMFDGKHFHFEKKWIRKKDYDNFIERKRKIGLPIYRGLEMSNPKLDNQRGETVKMIIDYIKAMTDLEEGTIYVILFGILMIILAIIFIIAIYKFLRNNEKYNKIKLMTE
ncbi:fam-m protein [Plasmodium brasilianum]|uniref:fam-m protein n=1 Tax=Plasmodium brasilianum TaxID=5824 RepID=UPI00350E48DA|nr:fam-m protein [Plasmodium brasilianum]